MEGSAARQVKVEGSAGMRGKVEGREKSGVRWRTKAKHNGGEREQSERGCECRARASASRVQTRRGLIVEYKKFQGVFCKIPTRVSYFGRGV